MERKCSSGLEAPLPPASGVSDDFPDVGEPFPLSDCVDAPPSTGPPKPSGLSDGDAGAEGALQSIPVEQVSTDLQAQRGLSFPAWPSLPDRGYHPLSPS